MEPYGQLLPVFQKIATQGMGMLRGWRAWVESTRATITIRPQLTEKLKVRRLVLPQAEAGNWLVHDIQIGKRSQLTAVDVHGIPASAFLGPDSDLNFSPPAPPDKPEDAVEIAMEVEYVGDDPAGATFRAAFICDLETVGGQAGRRTLPIASAGPLRPTKHAGGRIAIQIDDRVWSFAEDRAGRRVLVKDATEQWIPIGDSADPSRGHLTSCDGRQHSLITDDDRMIVIGVHDSAHSAPIWSDLDLDCPTFGAPPKPSEQGPGYLHPVKSIPVSLHALEIPGPMLFGIDERSGKVVFEIGVRRLKDGLLGTLEREFDPDRHQAGCQMRTRFSAEGFVPDWWEAAVFLNRDIRELADDSEITERT